MTGRQSGLGSTLHSQALRPPMKDMRFWFVQAMMVGLAAETLAVRLHSIPAGVPVVLLVIPVGYAAVRYRLAGSIATAVFATLLWLPDLLLPHDKGHVGNDVTELVVVIAVAAFVGYYRAPRIHSPPRGMPASGALTMRKQARLWHGGLGPHGAEAGGPSPLPRLGHLTKSGQMRPAVL